MTLVFFGDAEPNNTSELIKDFNASVTLSPSGNINAVILMGDMTTSSGTMPTTINALNGSTLKDKPVYFVIGNHEYDSKSKSYPVIKNELGTTFPLSKFSGDTSGNTFSFDDGDIHVAIINEYYNNSTGKVSQAMFDWLSQDLSKTDGYKIVVGHDPMYPLGRHEGDSLDSDKTMRNKMQDMLVSKNVNIFIGGHVHYSTIQTVDGILHVCTGVIGPGVGGSGDDFATINYVHIDSQGRLILTVKQDKSNSWSNPKIITKIISGDITPVKHYRCVNNSCEEDSSGKYTDPDCNNECTSAERYKCSNNECIKDPSGIYTDPNCENECNPSTSLTKISLTGCAAQPKRVGDKCTMTPTCYSNESIIPCPSLMWTSSNSSIVSVTKVDGKGSALALREGSCNITAKSKTITSKPVQFEVIESQSEGNTGLFLLIGSAALAYYLNKKGYFKKFLHKDTTTLGSS